MITITVPGVPIPKARPRFGRGRTYTPQSTVDYESAVRVAWLASDGGKAFGPVSLELWFVFPCPAHDERKRNPARARWHEKSVDLDNCAKAVADALNGYAYHDDRQVVTLTARKLVAPQGEPPRTVVMVRSTDSSAELAYAALKNAEVMFG